MHQVCRWAVAAALCATGFAAMATEAKDQAPAAAAVAKASDDAAKQTSKDGKDHKAEMVCTTERVTGSRFARRICHSREEREMMQRAGRETVDKIQEMPIPLKSE